MAASIVVDENNNYLLNNNNNNSAVVSVLSDIATIRYELDDDFINLVGPVYTSRCFKAHNLFWRLLFVLKDEFDNNDNNNNNNDDNNNDDNNNDGNNENGNGNMDDEDEDDDDESSEDNLNVTVFILSFNETTKTWGSTNPGLFAAKFNNNKRKKVKVLFDEDGTFQMKRRDIIASCLQQQNNNHLNDGTSSSWIIDVDIQIYIDKNKDKQKPVWYPQLNKGTTDDESSLSTSNTNSHFQCKQMLESPKYADVLFLVGINKTKFHAHRSVLYHQAPMLHDLVENSTTNTTCIIDDDDDENDSNNNNNNNAIEIPNIMESTFKSLLEYIYTGKLPEIMTMIVNNNNNDDDDDNEEEENYDENYDSSSSTTTSMLFAKDLLYATNKFGLTDLKLYIESEIISKKLLNLNNAAEWLLIADGHTCAYLKETCMKMYCSNPTTIKSTISWTDGVSKSSTLLCELLDYVEIKNHMCRIPIGPHDYCNMDVRTLREKLTLSNLDVDGSRDVLIKRLKDYYNNNVATSSSDSTTKRNIQLLR